MKQTLFRRIFSAASANASADGGHPTKTLALLPSVFGAFAADSNTPHDAKPAEGVPAADASAVAIPNVSPAMGNYNGGIVGETYNITN